MIQTLPYAEWTPDLPHVASGTTVAKNVIPHEGSYLQFNGLTSTSDALTAYCRGAAVYQDKDGGIESYAGDATKLYRLASAAWADKSGATYTTGASNFWRFVKYGERVIATNFNDAIQTKAFGAGTNFAALTGSPPKARAIGVCKSFIVLGDIDDGTHFPSKVAWSGQNLETSWGSNPATQADSQLLAGDGGKIMAITSGSDLSLVFQERSVWVMEYQGPPVVFSFHEIGPGLGTPAPRSVVRYGPNTYFLSNDGFYMHTLGGGFTPIGDKKVDLWLLERISKTNFHRMVGAVDVLSGKILWSYPTADSDPDEIIIYDYKTGQWSYACVDLQMIYEGRAEGYDMDTAAPGALGMDQASGLNLDAMGLASLDSDIWKGGALGLYGFGTDNKSGTFAGMPLTATVETIEMARDDSQIIRCNNMRPLVQGASAVNTMSIGTRNTLNSDYTFNTGVTANAIGEHNTRAAARYMRFRNEISGGFERAVGVRINVDGGGVR
jgi:hypothetical protein